MEAEWTLLSNSISVLEDSDFLSFEFLPNELPANFSWESDETLPETGIAPHHLHSLLFPHLHFRFTPLLSRIHVA